MSMSDEFAKEFGGVIWDNLFDAYYTAVSKGNEKSITVNNFTFISYSAFSSMSQGSASGYFRHKDKEVSFELRDGNNNGSEILSYEVVDDDTIIEDWKQALMR